eukprot:TRINITY_DN6074_c0_g2_i1.p1 TRINITY_DN6074_c0_g2~~TRINITY_DN6074_c0_g2_i1.p1  ORF type:complete len:213 (-),score=30.12 TRINITY_DN6074_c0_g2_i1:34-672(-)
MFKTASLHWLLMILSLMELISVIHCQPIPHRIPGWKMNVKPNAAIQFEVFVDYVCPDSAVAYPTIRQLLDTYGDNIQITMYVLALPYHHNSFYASKLGTIIEHTNRPKWVFVEEIFKNQQQWFNTPTRNLTAAQVVQDMGKFLEQFDISSQDFQKLFWSDEIEETSRIAWKYATSRGVFGTPQFFVNGVPVLNAQDNWSVKDWSKILDPIIN